VWLFLAYSQVNWLSSIYNNSFTNSDNPQCNCEHISMHFLQQKSNKAKVPPDSKLRKMQQKVKTEVSEFSHHMHNLAFRKFWCGGNSNGITSATPTDLTMHAYCHGVLVYEIKILFTSLSNQEKMSLIWLQWICFITSRAIKAMSFHITCLLARA